jgi:hypothetical protein
LFVSGIEGLTEKTKSSKKIAEEKLQFCIVRDLEYDGAKCYDFAHTILQKHVMDLTSKMYKKYLENFGMD